MNSRGPRPTLRDIFATGARRPEVYFYTSNDDKFLQARLVFEQSGLVLRHHRSKKEPYSEDYTAGKESLLTEALTEVLRTVGKSSLLFVEDTSLRLNGLSAEDDFPGLAVKEWFADTSFEQLDEDLRRHGNDRTATVKSDIALHVPGLRRPVFFHGETVGAVADSPPSFEESPHYPWLTPHTFNGWFVPAGAEWRLGEMDFEESCRWDFRVQALFALLDRVEEYGAVLNLPPQGYSRRPERKTAVAQKSLFTPERSVLVVVGRTCAGKTTFGERALHEHGAKWIEASSVLRGLADRYEHAGKDAFELAQSVLKIKGYDAVARRIVDDMLGDWDNHIVITGFRTFEEVEVMKAAFPDARVVLVEATERTRFERHVKRRRDATSGNRRAFRESDKKQWLFGLLRVAEEFADVRIRNEGTLDEYHDQVDFIVAPTTEASLPGVSTRVNPRHRRDKNQLYRCLVALRDAGRPLSCDEIQDRTESMGQPVRHNNANKVLKRVPELARRLELEGARVRYEIENAGRAYISLMDALA